jgi:type IV pilus assembly protein PilB
MKINDEFLKKILVDSDLVSKGDFNLAEKESKARSKPIEEIILEKGLVSDEELGKLIADEIGIPFINLQKVKIDKSVLDIVPEIVAKEQGIIVFQRTREGLEVAMSNPENLEIQEFIEKKTGEKVIPHFAAKRDIIATLKYYRKEIKEEFEDLIGKSIEEFEKADTRAPQSLPITKIVNLILNYGYENRASDIHLEPYAQKTVLRYRIDGVLHDVLNLPRDIHDFLVSRIKILSKLRTDEHDSAQDGHFSFGTQEEKIDVRVSIVPIEEGEKIAIRILAEKTRGLDLEGLGLRARDLKILEENIKKSWGMILVTGPTGHGKTTTLYAILKVLNKREVNIFTIEDPIEYDIEGINQIQVNPKTNLTFAEGLKAMVRQNPDIIMVGEVRDEETAKLAVNAAMTGHLVLSTFHATDSTTTLVRLLDMGIEPFLITSTVNLIIAQRLIRRVCPKCVESFEVSFAKISKILSKDLAFKFSKGKEKIMIFRGRGCPLCQQTGYLGRVGIFEILEMTQPIKELVIEKADAQTIREKAQKLGMVTMIEDGLQKVEEGITTLEEVLRAIKE